MPVSPILSFLIGSFSLSDITCVDSYIFPSANRSRGDLMKIAMAMENFSRYGGGAESYAVGLAQTLVSEGWEVHLYGHSWDGQPAEAVFHSIPKLPALGPSVHKNTSLCSSPQENDSGPKNSTLCWASETPW